jgi:hypothetical protein
VDEFETVDGPVFLLAKADGRAPALPALRAFAEIERGAQEGNDDARANHI